MEHILITGASSGLGKAIALQLAASQPTFSLTLFARSKEPLDSVAQECKALSKSETQKFIAIPTDVTSLESLKASIEEAETIISAPISTVFMCAGSSTPGMFLEQPFSDYKDGMDLNYFGSLYTARLTAQKMVSAGISGKLVFISSTLGLMNFTGYSQYSPCKTALRALAEILRQELSVHSISVHTYYVGTIETAGYINENKTKPKVTLELEGPPGSDAKPETRASTLLNALYPKSKVYFSYRKRPPFAITSDFLTDLFRVRAIGVSPHSHNILWDLTLLLIGIIAVPIWRNYADWLVQKRYKEKMTAIKKNE